LTVTCKKNKRACGQSTNVQSFHHSTNLLRVVLCSIAFGINQWQYNQLLHQAEWQMEIAGEKLSTEGGDDPNGNTIGCQDNKWLETLSRERIQDRRTMSVHMVILPSM
jgi:hypothetical protein